MASHYFLNLRKWPMGMAAVGAIGAATAVALVEERLVVRRFLVRAGDAAFGWFIATLGFSLVVDSVLIVRFGNAVRPIPSPFDHVRTSGVATSRYPKAVVVSN